MYAGASPEDAFRLPLLAIWFRMQATAQTLRCSDVIVFSQIALRDVFRFITAVAGTLT
jgi:hypothetical protein